MQLLIYETAVPVSSLHHATASVDVGTDYRFSKKVNSRRAFRCSIEPSSPILNWLRLIIVWQLPINDSDK